jgi:hypothetical protein
VDPRLGRQLDAPGGEGRVGLLDQVELLVERRQERGDLLPGQV